ncbi:DUF885 domain-containing protein [Microbulbifer discodermiae]|uniref:DUF885 domain-containing protein n=1 Tax=Microbulbifer sp. 2201CG32-9 TaxID=3232309 RepID=UPI00345BFD08
MKQVIPLLLVALALTACERDPVAKPNGEMAENVNGTESSTAKLETAEANREFQELADQMVEELWQLFPSWGISAGYYEVADQMEVPDRDFRERVVTFSNSYLRKFRNIDRSQLDAAHRSDLALIENFLDRMEWEVAQFKPHEWNPAEYNVSHPFALIINTEYAPLDERLRTFSKRMEKVPAYYQAAQQSLRKPAAPQLLLAIQQNEGALSVFGEELEQQLADSGLSAEEKQLFTQRLAATRDAIQGYVDFLKGMQGDLDDSGDYKDFRIGEDLYEQKFAYDIQIGMTGKELYQRALQEKDRLHAKMAELASELWPRYFPDQPRPEDPLKMTAEVLDKLSENHATKATFKAEVEKQIPELIAFVNEKDLLTLDPDKPLVVRTTPPYMRGFSVASINAPGPYDKTANTYYNVMPIEDFSDEQAESFLREYNSYLMQILNIHEAIPGHYTQLVYANKSPSLIKSILGNGAMVEGWAVYTERMMLEAGYGNFSPELWLMYYKWNLRTVINTILDYEIQVKGIDEQQAMDLMVRQGFQQKAEAMGKWRRATLSQVQLTSYFAGYSDILALRDEMKKKLGDDFDLKEFHEEFLSYGNAPVPVIRELMLAKLEEKQSDE